MIDPNRLLAIAERFRRLNDVEGARKLQAFIDARAEVAKRYRLLVLHIVSFEADSAISDAQKCPRIGDRINSGVIPLRKVQIPP